MVENKYPKFFYGYIVVAAAFLIMVVMWGTLYSFGIFFKPLLAELGWARAMTSGAYSLFMVLHGLLYIPAGRLNDKFGPRVIMIVCGFFLGLGYLLMSQVNDIWHLFLFYGVIVGFGAGGGYVPLLSTVSRWFVKRRGLMTGIVVSGAGFGTVIMPPVVNWLISDYGWRTSYIVVGIVSLVLIILAALFLRRDPSQVGQLPYGEGEAKEQSLDLEAGGFSVQRAIRTRQFWMFSVVIFSLLFSQQSIMVHIAPHATDLGISAAVAANILAIIGGLSIAGRLIMGNAADRIGNKPVIVTAFILMAITLFWLVAAREVWMFYLFAIVFGFAYGGIVSIESPIIAELFGMGSHGVIFGAMHSISTIGGAIGPVLAGRIFDITGSYQPAFLVYAVVAVIGLILVSLLRPAISQGGTNGSRNSA